MEVMLILLALAVGSMGLAWYHGEPAVLKRLIKEAKRREIASFSEGDVGKVTGKLHLLNRVLESPLTGRRCAYYRIMVSVDNSDKYRGGWEEIAREEDCVDFEIEDHTGRAYVQTAEFKAVANDELIELPNLAEQYSERIRKFLETRSRVAKALDAGRRVQFLEATMQEGEMVSVFGTGAQEVDPKAAPTGYRDAPPKRLRLESRPKRPIVISDVPSVY